MSNLTIRPLTPDGYPAAVEIESIACHCPPRTVEEIRFEEERYDSQSKFRRSVVESRQVGIVGVGSALYDFSKTGDFMSSCATSQSPPARTTF